MERYLNQKSYPDLEFILEMMDLRPGCLEHFIENFIHQKYFNLKSIMSIPWATAVANAASLKTHMNLPQHSNSWIADFLKLTELQVSQAIQLLVNIGLIEKSGPHYAPTLARTIGVSSKAEPLTYSRFIRYWMGVAQERFNTLKGEPINFEEGANRDGFRVFASSKEGAKQVTKILMQAEQEIHNFLVNDTQEKTDVRILLFHHFSAQDVVKK